MSGDFPTISKIKNQVLKNKLLNHQYLGTFVSGKASNILKESSFKTFFKKDTVSADHILDNGFITTKTQGIQFELKSEFKTGYTYTLTDSSGNVIGKTWIHMNNFFIKTDGADFLSKEYTLSATSDKTGEIFTLAKFTPFNIF